MSYLWLKIWVLSITGWMSNYFYNFFFFFFHRKSFSIFAIIYLLSEGLLIFWIDLIPFHLLWWLYVLHWPRLSYYFIRRWPWICMCFFASHWYYCLNRKEDFVLFNHRLFPNFFRLGFFVPNNENLGYPSFKGVTLEKGKRKSNASRDCRHSITTWSDYNDLQLLLRHAGVTFCFGVLRYSA